MRYVRAFGAFWYDFLVGDRPELFVGSIVALALVWLVIRAGLDAGAAGWLLTLVILVVAGLGILTASRPKR
ncbi:MAG: hypothetical protein ACYDAK_11110 [Candidatus Limnocylindrales bacterium]